MNKGKKLTRMAMVCACMLAFPFAAQAAVGDFVEFEQNDANRVMVSVGMNNAYNEQITGVSLKLKVDVEKGKEKVSFSFPAELKESTTGYRYHNGYLYIYVAGSQGIFDENDELMLGELTAKAATSAELKAKISYAAGGYQVTNAAYGSKLVDPDTVSEAVWVTQKGTNKPDETKPDETKPDETKPGETKPGETKPDETKPGETKPGETKPDSGNTGGSGSGGSGSGSGSGGSGSGSGSGGSSSGSDSDDGGESASGGNHRRKPVKANDTAIPSYVVKGSWIQTGDQWKFRDASGKEYKNSWAAVVNPYANTAAGQSAFDWFRFDADGNMMTGWITDPDGNVYYCNPVSDNTRGRMLTGWAWIADANGVKRCYYFNPVSDGFRGKLIKNAVIDGSSVNADGAWTVNGVVQVK